ncbi:FbpB family small basic protein [Bacillus sp. FJAT-45350]|uniref:FbpB family small basic protein n=1 Tax=Bacillus sp. FJAT-45350 TaxID=2011014 RepID=UPI000BB956E2|nr:FbpB family small basic protein [Bacillus sp. FJAT-45350]
MRKVSPTFEELVEENKRELLKDSEAINQIEKRIEERKAKEFADSTKKSEQ